MHKIINYTLLLLLIVLGMPVNANISVVQINSLPTGSEGDAVSSDKSSIAFDTQGLSYCTGNEAYLDWSAQGQSNLCLLYAQSFEVQIYAAAAVDTLQGSNLGAMTRSGGIDRDGAGLIGVRGTTNGIDPAEGLILGLDMSKLNSALTLTLTSVRIKYVADAEKGMIVNRNNPEKFIHFDATTHTSVNDRIEIDITPLDIKLNGGSKDAELLSIINTSSAGSYRIEGFTFAITERNPKGEAYDYTTIAPHPRLLMNNAELEQLKVKIAESESLAQLHNHIKDQADLVLTLEPVKYEKNGKRLLDVSREALRRIFYLSYCYRMTGSTAYFQRAEKEINAVCEFPDWNHSHYLDVAEMCTAVAIGYDWLFEQLSQTTKAKAAYAISRFAFNTSGNGAFYTATNNWNQVCNAGLVYGALAIYDEHKTKAAAMIDKSMKSNPVALEAYAPHGNYLEGAMYWAYGTSFQVMLMAALESALGSDNGLSDYPGFMSSAQYMQYMAAPTQQWFNYADCNTQQTPKPIMYWFAAKENDYSLIYEEERLKSMGAYFKNMDEVRLLPLAVIFAKDIPTTTIAPPTQKLWVGEGITPIVIARTGWGGANEKYLGIKGGSGSTSHAHLDAGSFVYDANRYRWIMDMGLQSYGAVETKVPTFWDLSQNSGRWDVFRLHNKQHSTLTINNQRHNVKGNAKFTAYYNQDNKLGGKIDLTNTLNLSDELSAASRDIFILNQEELHITDSIHNNANTTDLYWNIVTPAAVQIVDKKTLRLKQGTQSMLLTVSSECPFVLTTSRPTNPTNSYEHQNNGINHVGFNAQLPANTTSVFHITLVSENIPSTTPENYLHLDLHTPNKAPEGDKLFADISYLGIDTEGKAYISGNANNYAWNVTGSSDIAQALGTQFTFRYAAMGTANLTTGSMITPAGIDRAANGALGIRGGTNGIDPNEGYLLGLNLKNLPSTVSVQLSEVLFDYVDGTETGIICSRTDTNNKITYGASGTQTDVQIRTKGAVNVEQMNLRLKGGQENSDFVSVFSNSTKGSYRIIGFRFKVLDSRNTDTNAQTAQVVSAHPNPFVDYLNIQTDTQNPAQAILYTLTGNVAHSTHIPSGKSTLNLQHLPPGIYTLSIRTPNKILNQKIIKQ